MERNYEKELGLTQKKLSEALAREVMLTALLDDLTAEIESLKERQSEVCESGVENQ